LFEEHLELINSILKTQLGVKQADSVEILYAGLTSIRVYKVTVKNKSYVFKFRNKCSVAIRDNERQAMIIAIQRGIAPKVLYEEFDAGVIVTDYIDSPLPSELVPLSLTNLRLLAETIRRIHEGPFFGGATSILQITRKVINKLEPNRPPIVDLAIKRFNKIEHELRNQMILKPCHNDLNPNNILFCKEGLKIIDWETAGQSDPFYDLACPIMTYEMDEMQQVAFLSFYFKRQPTQEEIHKLNLFKQCHLIYYGCYYLLYESKVRNLPLLSESEIAALDDPMIRSMELHFDLLDDYREVQKYAHYLLRKALIEE